MMGPNRTLLVKRQVITDLRMASWKTKRSVARDYHAAVAEGALREASKALLVASPSTTSVQLSCLWAATWEACAAEYVTYADRHVEGYREALCGKDQCFETIHGYPADIVRADNRQAPEGQMFRIYCHSADEQAAIMATSALLASRMHYRFSEHGRHKRDYVDLTGIFVTRPAQTNRQKIGVQTSHQFVDFRFVDANVPLFEDLNRTLFVPGPRRLAADAQALSFAIPIAVVRSGAISP